MLRRDVDKIQSIEEIRSVRLLPSWDTYVMFYHPREFFVPQEYRTRIFGQIQGNAPVLLVDGIAGGTWQKIKKRAGIEIMVRPFKTPVRPRSSRLTRRQDYYGSSSGPTSKSTLTPESETYGAPGELGSSPLLHPAQTVHVNLRPNRSVVQ